MFPVALDETMRLNFDLPNGNVVDAESNVLLLESFMQLQITICKMQMYAVYDGKSDSELPNKMARCCEINIISFHLINSGSSLDV